MDLSLSSTLSLGFSSQAPPSSLESATHPVPPSLPSFKSRDWFLSLSCLESATHPVPPSLPSFKSPSDSSTIRFYTMCKRETEPRNSAFLCYILLYVCQQIGVFESYQGVVGVS